MTLPEALPPHRQLCDELHQCALEENRFLRQHQQPLPADMIERKRALLERLDLSLAALRRRRDPYARALRRRPAYRAAPAFSSAMA